VPAEQNRAVDSDAPSQQPDSLEAEMTAAAQHLHPGCQPLPCHEQPAAEVAEVFFCLLLLKSSCRGSAVGEAVVGGHCRPRCVQPSAMELR